MIRQVEVSDYLSVQLGNGCLQFAQLVLQTLHFLLGVRQLEVLPGIARTQLIHLQQTEQKKAEIKKKNKMKQIYYLHSGI